MCLSACVSVCLYVCVCLWCVCMSLCVCVCYICLDATEARRRRHHIPRARVTGGWWAAQRGCWATNLCPLEEQVLLAAEPSIQQPFLFVFFFKLKFYFYFFPVNVIHFSPHATRTDPTSSPVLRKTFFSLTNADPNLKSFVCGSWNMVLSFLRNSRIHWWVPQFCVESHFPSKFENTISFSPAYLLASCLLPIN